MHDARHPSQVRSSCERCRRQKVRCSGKNASDTACARCARLNVPCEAGEQRRIGRPVRQNGTVAKRSPTSLPSDQVEPAQADASAADDVYAIGFLDDANSFSIADLNFALGTPMSFSSGEDTDFSVGSTVPSSLVASEMLSPDPSSSQCQVLPVPHMHFRALSRLNSELYEACSKYRDLEAGLEAKSFEFLGVQGCDPITIIQSGWRCGQELIQILKSMHEKAGLKAFRNDLSSDHYLPPALGSGEPVRPPAYILDSPTALIIMSCYIQIINLFEMLISSAKCKLTTREHRTEIMEPGKYAFAGVTLFDTATQLILCCELSKHSLSQMNVLLGLPLSPYPIQQGLLSPPQYRNILNKELGSIEGDWSSRPRLLLDSFMYVRSMLEQCIATGIY